MLTLVLGGSRSGKSQVAEAIAQAATGPVRYVATGVTTDPEMAARIDTHRARRPADWQTIEVITDLAGPVDALVGGTVLIDSATIWIGNLLLTAGDPPDSAAIRRVRDEASAQAATLAGWAAGAKRHLIVVSDEVGGGVVPASALGRLFRDLLGEVNQAIAARADRVLFVIAGIPLDLRKLEWKPE